MNKKKLEAFAAEVVKNLKTEKDLSDFSRKLKKITIEAALGAELDEQPAYDKHPQICRSWRQNWENLNMLFAYAPDITQSNLYDEC